MIIFFCMKHTHGAVPLGASLYWVGLHVDYPPLLCLEGTKRYIDYVGLLCADKWERVGLLLCV